MSGEKKFNKDAVIELLERKTYNKKFQADVNNIRNKHDITQNGFSEIDYAKWIEKYDHPVDFEMDVDKLLIKYKLPLGANYPLAIYIATNSFRLLSETPPDFYSCGFDEVWFPAISSPVEEKWRKSGKKFIRIYIGEDASLPMVKKYIEQHWPFIKKTIFKKTKYQKLVRRGSQNKRNKLVWNYYQKSRAELKLRRGEYKEIKVAEILKEKHGISVTPENIRKIVQRMKQLRDS